jgi:hypothetical protein
MDLRAHQSHLKAATKADKIVCHEIHAEDDKGRI